LPTDITFKKKEGVKEESPRLVEGPLSEKNNCALLKTQGICTLWPLPQDTVLFTCHEQITRKEEEKTYS
jgi:hypothetical protein